MTSIVFSTISQKERIAYSIGFEFSISKIFVYIIYQIYLNIR
jgi:hypothetical protein